MTSTATETWAIGYTKRDLSGVTKDKEVEVDGELKVKTDWGYAYYATFEEAHGALLSIVGSTGLDFVRFQFPEYVVMHMAEAAVELMRVTAKEVEAHPKPLFCDIDGQMAFFMQKGEVETPEDDDTRTFELIADHRNCTDEHCYSEDTVTGNEHPYADKLDDTEKYSH